jgi:hypothetical protein
MSFVTSGHRVKQQTVGETKTALANKRIIQARIQHLRYICRFECSISFSSQMNFNMIVICPVSGKLSAFIVSTVGKSVHVRKHLT